MPASFWTNRANVAARHLGVDLTHAVVLYARTLAEHVTPGIDWLEIGCGRQILPEWAMEIDQQRVMAARARRLIGVDVDPSLWEHPLLSGRAIASADALPFPAGSFDLATAAMVVEHLPDPCIVLREIYRVLRPNGRLVFHTPNYTYYLIFLASLCPQAIKNRIVRFLEYREPADVFPTYYRLNTVKRISRAARDCGFELERLSINGSSGSFGRLGPLGLLEIFLLKGIALFRGGRHQPNLVVVLRRPADR